MRPSLRLIYIALGLTGLGLILLLALPESGLLVGALWLVLALAGFADVICTLPPRSVSLALRAPSTGYVGRDLRLEFDLNARRPLPKGLALRLDTEGEVDPPADMPALTSAQPGPLTLGSVLPLRARGKVMLRRASLIWPSRFGLWDMIAQHPLDHEITAVPDISPVLSGEINAQMLPLMDGLKDQQLRGEGSEFHQLREFTTGMDPRSIDWKRSARMRSLVARETRAERNHQIILGVDCGHLMSERVDGLPKIDRAINASLAMTWAGGLGGDLVGFYAFDSRPRLYMPPEPGRLAFPRIQAASASLLQEPAETNHTLALSHLMGRLKRRSLIILFSDFADSITSELLVENTAILARHHLVLYVALRDPALQATARGGSADLDSIAAAVTAQQMLQERAEVLERLTRLGVLCLDTTPDALTPALVSRYIDIKSRELI